MAAKAWAVNNAQALRAALHEGIKETIRMFKMDFMPKATAEKAAVSLGAIGELKVMSIVMPRGIYKGGVDTIKLDRVASEVLARDRDRVVYRTSYYDRHTVAGHIHSSTTSQRFVTPTAVTSAEPSGDAKP